MVLEPREDQAAEVLVQEHQVKEQTEDLAEEERGLLVNLVEDQVRSNIDM